MRALAIRDRGRGPELVGTRITVFDVLHYLQAGRTPLYIAAVLGMSTREVDFMIDYIEQHKEEVMAENAKIEARIARGNPPEVEERLKASGRKLQELRAKLQREREQRDGEHEGDTSRS